MILANETFSLKMPLTTSERMATETNKKIQMNALSRNKQLSLILDKIRGKDSTRKKSKNENPGTI